MAWEWLIATRLTADIFVGLVVYMRYVALHVALSHVVKVSAHSEHLNLPLEFFFAVASSAGGNTPLSIDSTYFLFNWYLSLSWPLIAAKHVSDLLSEFLKWWPSSLFELSKSILCSGRSAFDCACVLNCLPLHVFLGMTNKSSAVPLGLHSSWGHLSVHQPVVAHMWRCCRVQLTSLCEVQERRYTR